ncbi:glycosyltransferase [Brumicola blandensis]|uniref:Glycosyltransferase n=1 Tax=Brumicola blandensis TaxID=3075611 RepID=A0AAW8R1C3_9ALTE|nr:glycosyltransferase [Alteromonas sp. W409]MDT0582695.1 glycosyltransferase [Alteromonas sp. W409]
MKSKRVCFLVDHSLDPRLRKRVSSFILRGYSVVVYSDTQKGEWLATSDWAKNAELREYKGLGTDLDFSILYVSGAKVFIDKFWVLRRFKKNSYIISEIPDLPLRYSNNMLNVAVGWIFSLFVRSVSDSIVLTSQGFIEFFRTFNNVSFIENIPNRELVESFKLAFNKGVSESKCKIKLGYVGAIRYLEQLHMVLEYLYSLGDSSNIELHIYGGPINKFEGLVNKYPHFKNMINNNVFVHGPYDYENEIVQIYSSIDVVLANYDASQLNVRLALPNKLYESLLSQKPIIVSKKTFLSEKVKELNIGWCVESSQQKQTTFNEQMDAIVKELKSSEFTYPQKSYFDELELQESQFFSKLESSVSFFNKNV